MSAARSGAPQVRTLGDGRESSLRCGFKPAVLSNHSPKFNESVKLAILMGLLTRVSVLLFVVYSSCGGGPPSPDSPASFFSTMTSLNIEVVYEPGAEPFTGDTPVGARKI